MKKIYHRLNRLFYENYNTLDMYAPVRMLDVMRAEVAMAAGNNMPHQCMIG
jgi:hypothetical protein